MEVKIVKSNRRKKTVSARLQGNELIVSVPTRLNEKDIEKYTANLRKKFLAKQENKLNTLEKRAQVLNKTYFGGKLKIQRIRFVTNQNYRFGSCSVHNGEIRLSYRLLEVPDFVLDYVIVHELAHLMEPNHGEKFWELVKAYPKVEKAQGYLMALTRQC